MKKKTSFEEYINEHGSITYKNKGTSMLPLLREGKDLFTIEKKSKNRCKTGDVILYRSKDGKYLLHRIIKVRNNDYVILGDNCINREYGITDEDIIGVMNSFVRDGKEHNIEDKTYKIYRFLILNTIDMRILIKKMIGKLRKLK